MTATELLADLPNLIVDVTGGRPLSEQDDAYDVVERALRTLAALERLNELADASPFLHPDWSVGVHTDAPCMRGMGCPKGMTEQECGAGPDDMPRCKQPMWQVTCPSMYGPDAETPADALIAWAAMPEVG